MPRENTPTKNSPLENSVPLESPISKTESGAITVELTLPRIEPEILRQTMQSLIKSAQVSAKVKISCGSQSNYIINNSQTHLIVHFSDSISSAHAMPSSEAEADSSASARDFLNKENMSKNSPENQLSEVTLATEYSDKNSEGQVKQNNKNSDENEDTTIDTLARSSTAILSLETPHISDSEKLFRQAIALIESVDGLMVEGISPLYFVDSFTANNTHTAVVQVNSFLEPRDLLTRLHECEEYLDDKVDIDVVDYEGVTIDEPDCQIPWKNAMNRSAILSPWLDMDSQARCGKESVAYLLATCHDATFCGSYSTHWIVGDMS